MWRFWAMLWQAGGSILTPDGKQAAFDSPAGHQGADAVADARPAQVDLSRQRLRRLPGVFNSGHIGMLWTGPWDLSQITASQVDYGVTILPADQNHQTISGPDNWVMFNNGIGARGRLVGVPEVVHLADDRSQVGDDDRRPADPRRRPASSRATRSS